MDEFDPALLEERVDLGCFVKILGKPEKKDGKEFQLEVPTFQRPYSWSRTLVKSFTKCLFKAFDNREKYFASTVFLHLDPKTTKAYVFDGQQRLTTLSLIIMVLRDRLSELEKNYKSNEIETKKLMKHLTNEEGNSRLTFKFDQKNDWDDLVNEQSRFSSKRRSTNIFKINYVEIKETFEDWLTSAENENEKNKRLLEFSKKLLEGEICYGIRLTCYHTFDQSIKMLGGLNTPGLPLDIISHIKFDLMRTHDETLKPEENTRIRDKLAKKIDLTIPKSATIQESAILVAACALLKSGDSVEPDETTLTIVTKALSASAKTEFKLNFFITTDADGFNAEQFYWLSAIRIARYLENIESTSKNRLDLAIMPILALSRLKSTSNSGKTLRLIQSLLVMSILLSKGSVRSNGKEYLQVKNEEVFIKYLKKLETKLLHTLVIIVRKVEREKNMQIFIDGHLKILKTSTVEDAIEDLKLTKPQIDELLDVIKKQNTKIVDEMKSAGFTFAILLACQPKPDFGSRFDGLDGTFEVEHIAPKKSRLRTENKLINSLGNLCLIEAGSNASASNKPLSGKKEAYSESKFFVPHDFSLRLDNSFGDQQISARLKKMCDFLHKRFMESQGCGVPSTLISPTESDASPDNHDIDKQDVNKLRKLLDDDDKGFIVRKYFIDGSKILYSNLAEEFHLKAVFYVYNTVRPDPKYDGKKIKFKSMKKNRKGDENEDEDEHVEVDDNAVEWNKWKICSKQWYEKHYEELEKKYAGTAQEPLEAEERDDTAIMNPTGDGSVPEGEATRPVNSTNSSGKRKRDTNGAGLVIPDVGTRDSKKAKVSEPKSRSPKSKKLKSQSQSQKKAKKEKIKCEKCNEDRAKNLDGTLHKRHKCSSK